MKPVVSTKEEFKRDLEIGQTFEKEVAKLVAHKTLTDEAEIEYSVGKAYWDFKLGVMKYEVKCDARASETGNLAFEWSSRGNPSGLARLEHNYWCHGIGVNGVDGVLFGDSATVRRCVLEAFYAGKARFMPYLGDGTSGFLMKIEDVKEFMYDLRTNK